MAINFFEQVQKIEIPVYFISGKYDYITPISLIKEYVEMLESPYKKMIVFEKAAHDCHFEKSDQFVDVCMNILEEWKN